jgi:preprotein translocase subunit SecE
MARTSTRPQDEEEEILDEEEMEEEESVSSAPAVSDSRRRRQMKHGVDTSPAPATSNSATSSQTVRRVRTESNNFIVRAYNDLLDYFRDTRAELRKVAWPTREEALRLTYIVLAVTAVAAIFLGLISFLFSVLTTQIANDATMALAGAFTIVLIIIVAGVCLFSDRLLGSRLE